jgi:Predicted membrane protein (DUF2339)
VLLVVLASAGHELGVPERLGLAGAGAIVLMGLGIWSHERRVRTEASIAAVGAATVGMFVVLAACARTGTIPGIAAVAGSMLVGGLGVALAVRWAGQAIGWLGLLGAVVAPLAAGGLPDVTSLGLLLVALVCLLSTAVWRRWSWLALAGLVCAMPEWIWWSLSPHSTGAHLAVLGAFGATGLAAACAERRRHSDLAMSAPAIALVTINALVTGALGRLLVPDVPGDLWLAGFGAAHLALGSLRRARLGVHLQALMLAAGFVLVDVAFGLAFHGPVLAIGWAAAAVGFAWLRRRSAGDTGEPSVIDLGLGAHIALVLMRVAISAGDGGGTSIAATVALAVACLTASALVGPRRELVAQVLNGLGLAAIAWLTAQSVHGPWLVAAWTGEAVALAQIARRAGADAPRALVLRVESAAFLVLALGHVLLIEAPPSDLVGGSAAMGAAALALAALGAGALRAGLATPRTDAWRPWLLTGGAAVVLYLLSVAIITLFQPTIGAAAQFGGALVEFSVRQQGQVVLSIVWGLIGLGGVFIGLRRHQDLVRNVALGLLVIAIAKVFAYDLSTLTSVYRVASLLGFGALLLVSGFTYQRLRQATTGRR